MLVGATSVIAALWMFGFPLYFLQQTAKLLAGVDVEKGLLEKFSLLIFSNSLFAKYPHPAIRERYLKYIGTWLVVSMLIVGIAGLAKHRAGI